MRLARTEGVSRSLSADYTSRNPLHFARELKTFHTLFARRRALASDPVLVEATTQAQHSKKRHTCSELYALRAPHSSALLRQQLPVAVARGT